MPDSALLGASNVVESKQGPGLKNTFSCGRHNIKQITIQMNIIKFDNSFAVTWCSESITTL